MNKTVTIIDYGVGNLLSVQRALEHCGATTVLAQAPEDIAVAQRLVLPGVGAFADGMAGLRDRGLIAPIQVYAQSGRPLLGICLGMQMLATGSEEFGSHPGLGIIPGLVKEIPKLSTTGGKLKVPFIGWAPIQSASAETIEHSCLQGLSGRAAYLVHSFHVVPSDPQHLLATYSFGGHSITAAIRKENVTGLQFHPEKSSHMGLTIMKNFLISP